MTDIQRWRKELADARHSQLTDIRATAAKWASGITALLAIFAAASVIIVPSKLGDLHEDWLKWLVVCLAVLAGITGLLAMWLATMAAVGVPKTDPYTDALAFQKKTLTRTHDAANLLKGSRVLTYISIVALVLTAGASQSDAFINQSTPKVYVVVTSTSGQVICGALKAPKGGGAATVAGSPIDPTSSIVTVKHC